MASYSYEDFKKALRDSGLQGDFSEADMRLARQNPDAGMSILSYKLDYASAPTDDARALANQGAESIRSTYGGYIGGGDGGDYYLNEGRSTDDNGNYVNQYEDEQQALIDFLGREFSYDYRSDPAWEAYAKQYGREGERAFQNTLGGAAANTGGVASTYALTAAQQAQNYYGAQLSDRIPALRQQAYENYLAGQKNAVAGLGALDGLNAENYKQFADARALGGSGDALEYALSLWKTYGYATAEVAALLGVKEGTPTSDQAYDNWYAAYSEGKSGVSTGERPGYGGGQRGVLAYGSQGSGVYALQSALQIMGYLASEPDGVFGPRTRAALAAFQQASGLAPTGVTDGDTWAALGF